MNTGTLKNLLNTYNVKQICIKFPIEQGGKIYYVESMLFDKRSRSVFFLNVLEQLPPRTNRTQLLKSYISDFNDTHEVLIRDMSKNTYPLPLSNDIVFDSNTGVLLIEVASAF